MMNLMGRRAACATAMVAASALFCASTGCYSPYHGRTLGVPHFADSRQPVLVPWGARRVVIKKEVRQAGRLTALEFRLAEQPYCRLASRGQLAALRHETAYLKPNASLFTILGGAAVGLAGSLVGTLGLTQDDKANAATISGAILWVAGVSTILVGRLLRPSKTRQRTTVTPALRWAGSDAGMAPRDAAFSAKRYRAMRSLLPPLPRAAVPARPPAATRAKHQACGLPRWVEGPLRVRVDTGRNEAPLSWSTGTGRIVLDGQRMASLAGWAIGCGRSSIGISATTTSTTPREPSFAGPALLSGAPTGIAASVIWRDVINQRVEIAPRSLQAAATALEPWASQRLQQCRFARLQVETALAEARRSCATRGKLTRRGGVYRCTNAAGQQRGLTVGLRKDGAIAFKIAFDGAGVIVRRETFHNNSKPAERITYAKHLVRYLSWGLGGNICANSRLKGGTGRFAVFFQNTDCAQRSEAGLLAGKANGPWKRWSKDGRLTYEGVIERFADGYTNRWNRYGKTGKASSSGFASKDLKGSLSTRVEHYCEDGRAVQILEENQTHQRKGPLAYDQFARTSWSCRCAGGSCTQQSPHGTISWTNRAQRTQRAVYRWTRSSVQTPDYHPATCSVAVDGGAAKKMLWCTEGDFRSGEAARPECRVKPKMSPETCLGALVYALERARK